MMYDCYIIVGEEFKNVVENGKIIGFQFGLRVPYYSSIWLSLVGETELAVDGERFGTEKMTVTLRGKQYQHTRLEDEPYEKWEFGEIGILTVARPDGLKPGEHTVDVRQHVMVLVPGGFYGHDKKVLHLTG
jgi:hypothetical protein